MILKKVILIMFLMLFSIFFLIFTYNSASTKRPRLLYQVYLDDQIIGKIESKKELESYFEKEGKKIKKTLLEYTEDIEKQEDIVLINSLGMITSSIRGTCGFSSARGSEIVSVSLPRICSLPAFACIRASSRISYERPSHLISI